MSYARTKSNVPYVNFNFRVTIMHSKLGNIKCGFQSVSGLGINVTYKEYKEGGNNFIPDKLVETISDNPVQFIKGISDNEAITDLATFFFTPDGNNRIVGSFRNRFDILVEVMDRANRNAKHSYTLHDCVIENFLLGDLNALGQEIAIESFSVRFNALTKR